MGTVAVREQQVVTLTTKTLIAGVLLYQSSYWRELLHHPIDLLYLTQPKYLLQGILSKFWTTSGKGNRWNSSGKKQAFLRTKEAFPVGPTAITAIVIQ